MDYGKIYEALKTIQETCREMQLDGSCAECPMGNDDGCRCGVTDLHPDNWELYSPQRVIKLMS